MRKILHLDLDAFYASVEQRDDPALRGLPIAVGGSPRGGVVMTASYEARHYGIHSAMPGRTAARLCPNLIFVKPRFDAYREASYQMRTIMRQYTDLVEPRGLDEAYLDVTHPLKGLPSATLLAMSLREDIKEATGLTVSAGGGPNKFVAKVASAYCKPDGILVVPPSEVSKFLADLPVRRFVGVGPVTAKRLEKAGLYTGRHLLDAGETRLRDLLGKAGGLLFNNAAGLDSRKVGTARMRKSIGRQKTFYPPLIGYEACAEALTNIAQDVSSRLARNQLAARRVAIRIRNASYQTWTRQTSPTNALTKMEDIIHAATHLLSINKDLLARPTRLLGTTVSSFVDQEAGRQLELPLRSAALHETDLSRGG